ncbi:MAG: hypothetical protein LLG06_04060 [Desulfobacteraceae bacterium]|nr:hypothetical protein [Desulfobacteraceae bacterium]
MPCYSSISISYKGEVFKADPEILQQAIPAFIREMEAIYGLDTVNVSFGKTTCTIYVDGYLVQVDFQANIIRYAEGQQHMKNALKRQYSAAVIQRVAQSPRIKQKFSLKLGSDAREFTLARRK